MSEWEGVQAVWAKNGVVANLRGKRWMHNTKVQKKEERKAKLQHYKIIKISSVAFNVLLWNNVCIISIILFKDEQRWMQVKPELAAKCTSGGKKKCSGKELGNTHICTLFRGWAKIWKIDLRSFNLTPFQTKSIDQFSDVSYFFCFLFHRIYPNFAKVIS